MLLNNLNFTIKEPVFKSGRFNITWENYVEMTRDIKISKNLNAFLNNKKVIIVGPSPYLIGKKRGSFINSHDIVIRLNKGWKIPKELEIDYGNRTDILWHCMKEDACGKFEIESKINYGIKWIVSQFPRNLDYFENDIRNFIRINNDRIKFTTFSDLIFFLNLEIYLGTRPNVGQTAIIDLLNYNLKSLHVSGCTFFKDGHYDKYRSDKSDINHHLSDPQINLIKILNSNIKELTFDNEILEILNDFTPPIADELDTNFTPVILTQNKFINRIKSLLKRIKRLSTQSFTTK